MQIWDHFTQAERRVLSAIVVVSLVASGVSYVRQAHPEWFLGEPTFVAEPKPPLTPTDELETPSERVVPTPATSETSALASTPPATSPSAPSQSERAATEVSPDTKAEPDPARPIHLNTADAATLELLPGVGPVLAERIISYRREIGGFRAVDDLLDVKGIGVKTLAKIRPFVVVSP